MALEPFLINPPRPRRNPWEKITIPRRVAKVWRVSELGKFGKPGQNKSAFLAEHGGSTYSPVSISPAPYKPTKPHGKKGKKKITKSKKAGKKTMAKKKSSKGKKKIKRNPSGMELALLNPFRRRKHHYRKNPAIMGVQIDVPMTVGAVGGVVGDRELVHRVLQYAPVDMVKKGWGNKLARLVIGGLASYGISKVSRPASIGVVAGVIASVGAESIVELMKKTGVPTANEIASDVELGSLEPMGAIGPDAGVPNLGDIGADDSLESIEIESV